MGEITKNISLSRVSAGLPPEIATEPERAFFTGDFKMLGWIKLHRKLLNWEWYTDSNMVHLFIHLLLKANHEPGNWRGVYVKRGQVITGRKKLSQETGISERTIRTCLNRLKSTSELTTEPTNGYTIITISHYDSYQLSESQSDQQTDQPNANDRPASDQRPTTNKNNKNDNNEKENKIKHDFELFWEHYHENTGIAKTDKEAAFKYWKKLTIDEMRLAYGMVQDYKRSIDNPKYIKKARTYLRDKNFNDELRSSKKLAI